MRSIQATASGFRPAIDEARRVVFSYYIDRLLHCAESGRRSLPLDFNVRVLDRLTGLNVSGTDRGLIRARLFGKATPLPELDLDESVMCRVFQVVYEELCTLFGPVRADLYAKTALTATRGLPESALYSPNRLM